jgi:hypothetical protein
MCKVGQDRIYALCMIVYLVNILPKNTVHILYINLCAFVCIYIVYIYIYMALTNPWHVSVLSIKGWH